MEDYYLDEIGEVMREWNALHRCGEEEETERVDPRAFFGEDGELLR